MADNCSNKVIKYTIISVYLHEFSLQRNRQDKNNGPILFEKCWFFWTWLHTPLISALGSRVSQIYVSSRPTKAYAERVFVKESKQQSSTPCCQRKDIKPNWAPNPELQHLLLPTVTTTHGQLKSKITTHKNSGIIICKFRAGAVLRFETSPSCVTLLSVRIVSDHSVYTVCATLFMI